MTDREKVIRGLEFCSSSGLLCAGEKCSYNSHALMCKYYLMRDALALLKEQEPRVITLEELQAIGVPWDRNTPPYLFVEERSATRSRWMSWGFMHDCVRLPGTMGVQIYGTEWRVWNLQPTPDQMRDTKWEGDSDAETS